MADPHTKTEDLPPLHPNTTTTPLLDSNHTHHPEEQGLEIKDTQLDQTLQKLEAFLTLLGFNQTCIFSCILSWFAFVIIGVLLPVLVLVIFNCSDCDKFQIEGFELVIVGSQACLAAVSLLCLSHNLRKYGIRRFLFVDRYTGHMVRFRNDYINQIKGSFRLLLWWSLPCLLLKTIREVVRMLYVHHDSWWLSVSILLALVLSWTYASTITLTASILFHLVCNLQVIHFEDYGRLLERESDVLVFMEEHIRLRYHLSKISHRFRIFLLLQFLVVTSSQFVTLFEVTGYSGKITFINGGDFAVSTIVQVVGIIISLHAATRISHRAQALASLASRWHALVTSSSNDSSHNRNSNSTGNLEAANTINSLHLSYSESDLESCDYYVSMPTNTQLASYMSSYHRRQAFVMYLQTNAGGITIFGWTVDRALLNTIFFIELSLITFVLGKTIVFSST
ncbi:PREDICTED: uncharacterized protein LOC101297985 [Fragaria vesca subsp. vesca]|uniref:uncharacterized protein LOC101297985 n=1 Tax=Fragaria vesca subsp. vesca TaxID=101020 RepID=UPI0002C345DC|nr:PREDICTED: uncharacterized protein LOC101297985 [Fragaria vesca subsp. vesca]